MPATEDFEDVVTSMRRTLEIVNRAIGDLHDARARLALYLGYFEYRRKEQ